MRATRRAIRSRGLPAVAVAILAALPGCVTGGERYGRVIDPALVARVEVGVTGKQQVLDLFGPPTVVSPTVEGDTLLAEGNFPTPDLALDPGLGSTPRDEDVYTYQYREENEVFLSLALIYTYYSREVLTDTLMVVFDEADVVKYLAFTRQTETEPEPEPEAEE
jgi:hypothetical protein